MSWYSQAKIFFKEVSETRAREENNEEQKVIKKIWNLSLLRVKLVY